MRSTLKKSLYLGLAALSFASVAGAANNADAAKKTKPAKTYATASYQNIPNQGQSNVAYNVTGSNALFNKPGTVKGAKQVASKATMNDLASSKQNFMVYQTATTNRGSKYIKVVSFDKQYRGWIYAGNNTSASYGTGVQQINLATSASPQYSSVYLKNPGNVALKTSPEGSQFDASQNSFAQTGLVAGDKFTVDGAQTVNRTGTTWYHLIDQSNNGVNGWVSSDQVQLSSNNNYFDARNQIKVNYTDVNNGNIVKTSDVSVNSSDVRDGYANGILNPSGLVTDINKDVIGTSNNDSANGKGANSTDTNRANTLTPKNYTSSSSLYNTGYQLNAALDNNTTSLQYVTPGNTVNIPVTTSNPDTGSIASKINFYQTNGVSGATGLSTSNFTVPSVDSNQVQYQLNGFNSNQYVDMQRVLGNSTSGSSFNYGPNNIFSTQSDSTNPNKLGVLFGGTQYATSDITTAAANDQAVKDSGASVTRNSTIKQGSAFHYVYVMNDTLTRSNNSGKTYGQNINVYYDAIPVVNSSSNTTSGSTSGFVGN